MPKLFYSVKQLVDYIEGNNYKGYDPYDFLKSPLFKRSILKNNKLIRFYAQQFGKRFPFNLRSLFQIPKGYNPVTIGLAIEGYSYLVSAYPDLKDEIVTKVEKLVSELNMLIPKNFTNACWGYDFEWEARYASIPAYQPTVVATGIITNALFKYYQVSKSQKVAQHITSASEFVLKDLNRTYNNDTFCFSYSPFDKQVVFNASMKAVRILMQAYSISKNENLYIEARNAINFVMNYQQENGTWVYSTKLNKRIDNYHTGYILSCLKDYINISGDLELSDNLHLGYSFYKNNFIEKNGAPKFYHNYLYPIDCTSASQTIMTLIKFGDINLAENVAKYMLENMFDKKGFFYFRKFKYFLIKTPMMRWSQAWMFAALSNLLYIKLENS